MGLFAPPPTTPVPRQKVKEKKALPSDPLVPQKKVKEKKALPSASPIDPPTSKRRTQGTIPSESTPLGVGDWLTDKDILCGLNQELYHMEIDEPYVWTLVVAYIKRVSRWMPMVEFGSTLAPGAVATLLWSIAITKKGCTGLCVPTIVAPGWNASLFGFENP